MTPRIVVVAFCIFAGCATPQQRAERVVERYGPVCADMGHQPQTQSWGQCIMAMYQQDEARRMQLIGAGAALMATPPAPRRQICYWQGPAWVCQ